MEKSEQQESSILMEENSEQQESSYVIYYRKSCKDNNYTIDNRFITWIEIVEKHVVDKIGLNLLDLPDEQYMGNFQNNMMASQMAYIVVKNFYDDYTYLAE